MTNKEINNVIMKYLGTAYKFNGESLKEGLDCANLCVLVAKDFGVNIPNINHTLHTESSYSVMFSVRDDKSLWKLVESKFGTLCVFKINGEIKHVGFMINENDFIHIMENSKVTVDTLSSIQWKRRLVGCYEYIGSKLEI